MLQIPAIDSHTEGEPTRVILSGGPDLTLGDTNATVAQQAATFKERFDWFRAATVNEPRGHNVLVGALLVPPSPGSGALTGVIFYNNVGLLNACGHGTIGLAATLAHLGRLPPGSHKIETPVGLVTVRLDASGEISIDNVPSYRHAAHVPVSFQWQGHHRTVHGDIAWGGNWFFLVHDHAQLITLRNIDRLTDMAWVIRQALERERITGADGAHIDHVELFGPATRADCDSKNFVLCPGKAYDRSPCGTGTSAKLACLHADHKLAPNKEWRQESIIGSRFTARYRIDEEDRLIPTITGRAYITAETKLLIDERDPFRHGFTA